MPADPLTLAELETGAQALSVQAQPTQRDRDWAALVLGAVAPLIAARVRAEERESIARAVEAEADAYNARIATAAGVPNRSRDGMVSSGIRRAAAIARAHATTPGDDHAA